MDNVLQDMVQRLRAIELLLRTQNESLTSVAVGSRNRTSDGAEANGVRCLCPAKLSTNMPGRLRAR